MEGLQDFGIYLIQIIQTLRPALDIPMEFFTFLGRVEFYMVFVVFLYWLVDYRLGFRIFMVLLGTDIIGISLKQLLHQPRPYWIGGVEGVGVETSYGIPSTHASDSLSVWGYLAYKIRKRWLTIIAVFIIFFIAFSRLYLGVHFPHDVIGGWIIGLGVFFLFVTQEHRAATWLVTKSISLQVLIGFISSILFVIMGMGVLAFITPRPDPDSWSAFATEARFLSDYITLAGALFGAAAGYSLTLSKARFMTGGPWSQRIARYVAGLVGVAAVLYGLDFLFAAIASDETGLGYLLRYIRYGTTTFWALFGAPWFFIKTGLASPEKS